MPYGMCYSHFGNGVCNGAISITRWGFINDRYKVNPVGQWENFLVIAMGFVDDLRHHLQFFIFIFYCKEQVFFYME